MLIPPLFFSVSNLSGYRKKRKIFIAKLSLSVDDHIIISQEDMQCAVFNFYSELLGTPVQRNFTIDLN